MPEFFCELFSEEIPARMQARAAADLLRLLSEALAALSPRNVATYYGPRRIALSAEVAPEALSAATFERGPRTSAPEQAVAGFLRKHGAAREQLRQEGDFWVLEKPALGESAAALAARAMPAVLRRFPWPKSMRWGGTSGFTWVRPLRRICCLLDGVPVAFSLAADGDDGHGLQAGALTEGHRFHAPGTFAVTGAAQWQAALQDHFVIADAAEREASIARQIVACAAAADVSIVHDPGLISEVAGLVEWPVVLRGNIDTAYMELPAEVMQVSMRVNQRYFATRTRADIAAPYFVFVANIAAEDGGAAIVAGNERVLRARFSDARHFWDIDRRTPLADRVAALDGVTFHASLGTQGARVRRLVRLAEMLAPLVGADPAQAARAALLAKADLTTGMVGEFPELQGIMGFYYARHDSEPDAVADAVRDHYLPRGPADPVPTAPVSIAVALADKIDQLAAFFIIGQQPKGSGDPYALRRAALGIIRIIRDNGIHLEFGSVLPGSIEAANADARLLASYPGHDGGKDSTEAASQLIITFLLDRLRAQLKSEGRRHDVVAAAFAARAISGSPTDTDLLRLIRRSDKIDELLNRPEAFDILAGYRRGSNILRAEAKKGDVLYDSINKDLFETPEEIALMEHLDGIKSALRAVDDRLDDFDEPFNNLITAFVELRTPIDDFFENVTVNADDPATRRNRLALLWGIREAMNRVADFSALEG